MLSAHLRQLTRSAARSALRAEPPENEFTFANNPLTEGALGRLGQVVPLNVFNHAAAGLSDLRLYRDGTETPYVIRTAAPEEGAQKTISLLNLGVRGGQAVFDAELPEGKYSDLELAVTGQDFIATVAVSGSRAPDG